MEETESDIMFIVKNEQVIYVNSELDHCLLLDKDGSKYLDGRISNMVFTSEDGNNVIEFFVAFNEFDSYKLFTLNNGMEKKFNHLSVEIYKYFTGNKIKGVLTLAEGYTTEYFYTFKLYKKDDKFIMMNNSKTQGYIIDGNIIKRGSGELIPEFWG